MGDMTLAEKRRLLVGSRIRAVDWRRFRTGRAGGWTTDPILTLDDGSTVRFTVRETEGEYGIEMDVRPPAPR